MKTTLKALIIGTVAAVLVAQSASAGFIRLATSISSKIEGGTLTVLVTVCNEGDESAYSGQIEFLVGGEKYMSKKVEEFAVGVTNSFIQQIELSMETPGAYPLIATLHYADANQYPFSAMKAHIFPYEIEAGPSEIFGTIKETTFWKEGTVKLNLKNLGMSNIQTTTQLICPRELSVDEGSRNILVPAKSSGKAQFSLKNFAALSGSTYIVFAVSESEKNGVHHTTITPGVVKLKEQKKILGVSYGVLAAVLVVLVLVFVGFQKFKK